MISNSLRIAPLLAMLSAATMACASAQTTQGAVSGHVYGPDGKGLKDTVVWANVVSPLPRPVDRNSEIPVPKTLSAADGSFALAHMPDGDFVLCAWNKVVAALNPCGWAGAPLVKLTNGLNATGQSIHMAAAATLQVHLDDPSGLLAANAGKAGTGLIIGVNGPHGFVPLPIISSTGTSRDYKILVPFDTALNVMVSTQYFKLADAQGFALSGAAPIGVSIPTGKQASVVSLRITGAGN